MPFSFARVLASSICCTLDFSPLSAGAALPLAAGGASCLWASMAAARCAFSALSTARLASAAEDLPSKARPCSSSSWPGRPSPTARTALMRSRSWVEPRTMNSALRAAKRGAWSCSKDARVMESDIAVSFGSRVEVLSLGAAPALADGATGFLITALRRDANSVGSAAMRSSNASRVETPSTSPASMACWPRNTRPSAMCSRTCSALTPW